MSEVSGITFIVAAYNLGDSLVRCIRSIQEQSLDQIEVLIVNDKSTDNTLDIATNLCIDDPQGRTRCISHIRNLGLPAVRNTGLMAARMKYIWHVNGDDFLPHRNVAEKIFQSLEDKGLLAVKFPVFSQTPELAFNQKVYEQRLASSYSCQVVSPQIAEKKYGFAHAFSVVYDKNFALTLNIFNLEGVSLGEDQILVSQLFKKLPCIGLVQPSMYVYDMTEESIMRKSWSIEKYLEYRVHSLFINRLHRDIPSRQSHASMLRLKYISDILSVKAKAELLPLELNLLNACWLDDFNVLKGQEIKVSSKDKKSTIQSFFDDVKTSLVTSDYSSMFDSFLCDTSFLIYAGAHKTATTFLQSCLQNHRYQLACNGVIYINYFEFRQALMNKSTRVLSKGSDEEIKACLMKLIMPLLFCKPKKVIIFDENLANSSGKSLKPEFLHESFACTKNGLSLFFLKRLLSVLPTKDTSIVYCIRDLSDYIASRYCEKIKWGYLARFDDYVEKFYDNSEDATWKYTCEKLQNLCHSFKLKDPVIVSFEDIKDDLSGYLNFLVDCYTGSELNRLEDFDFCLPSSPLRSSPTSEAIDFVFEDLRNISTKSSQNLYKKLVLSEYGSSKYMPLSLDKYSFLREKLNKTYSTDLSSFVNFRSTSIAKSFTSRQFILETTFESLCDPVSSCVKSLYSQFENPSNDSDFISNEVKPIWSGLNCFDAFSNLEGDTSFAFKRLHFGFVREKGISAMLRVKNEELNIELVLLNCLKVFDEVVVIDNNSDDSTLAVVAKVRAMTPSCANKIRVYSYPFNVARCGQDNFDCPENSVHSLAFFYNYCLSLCRYSYIFKWDGDMLMPDHMVDEFNIFKKKVIQSGFHSSTSSSSVFGVPLGITVFKGHNGKYYRKPAEREAEPRLFENRSDVRFVKDILWEKLFFPHSICTVSSDKPVFIEFKDVGQDEFSHWKIGGLGMGPRKRRELQNFKQVSRLTFGGRTPAIEELKTLGFEEYLQPISNSTS